MPAKNSKKLTAQKFNTIKAQLNLPSNKVEHIAAANGVKPSTVRVIRRYSSLAAMRAAQANAAEKRAKKAANKSLEDYEKQLDEVVSKPENQIPARRKKTTKRVPKYITAQELDIVVADIMEHMSGRVHKLEKKVEDLQAFKDNIKATRLGRMIAKAGGRG